MLINLFYLYLKVTFISGRSQSISRMFWSLSSALSWLIGFRCKMEKRGTLMLGILTFIMSFFFYISCHRHFCAHTVPLLPMDSLFFFFSFVQYQMEVEKKREERKSEERRREVGRQGENRYTIVLLCHLGSFLCTGCFMWWPEHNPQVPVHLCMDFASWAISWSWFCNYLRYMTLSQVRRLCFSRIALLLAFSI